MTLSEARAKRRENKRLLPTSSPKVKEIRERYVVLLEEYIEALSCTPT